MAQMARLLSCTPFCHWNAERVYAAFCRAYCVYIEGKHKVERLRWNNKTAKYTGPFTTCWRFKGGLWGHKMAGLHEIRDVEGQKGNTSFIHCLWSMALRHCATVPGILFLRSKFDASHRFGSYTASALCRNPHLTLADKLHLWTLFFKKSRIFHSELIEDMMTRDDVQTFYLLDQAVPRPRFSHEGKGVHLRKYKMVKRECKYGCTGQYMVITRQTLFGLAVKHNAHSMMTFCIDHGFVEPMEKDRHATLIQVARYETLCRAVL